MSSKKNYNKATMCRVCGRVMRSDNLKKHMISKHKDDCNSIQYNEGHNGQEMRRSSSLEKCADDQPNEEGCILSEFDNVDAKLVFELQRNRDLYIKNVDIGRQVSIVLTNGDIPEESLSKEHKLCLDLFRAQQPTTEVASAELRPWQTKLLDAIEQVQMNDRMIIWVMGRKGNEGKSWFQSYIQSLHGAHRVARFDITNKTSDLLHIMSRCPLATTDMFLFNHQRCISSDDCCYSLLEMIKDGYASAPKFQGALLRIKTPNMVIVFSNREPRMHSLSLDRWKVFSIRDGKLVGGFEDQIWKTQKDDHAKAAQMR